MFSRGRQGGFRAGTGPLLILFAWASCGCRRWVRRFSGLGLGEFRVVGLRVLVGPRFSRYPGLPAVLKFPGVCQSPFARSSQVTRGLPVPLSRSLSGSLGSTVPLSRSLSGCLGSTTPLSRSSFSFPGESPLPLPISMEPVASWVSCDGGRRSTARRPSPLGLGAYASGRPANATSSQWAIGHQRSTA